MRRVYCGLQALRKRRIADPLFGDNAGDVTVRRHVEGRVVDGDARGRNRRVTQMDDFVFSPFFDGDVVAVGQAQVYGAGGRDTIDRNTVFSGDDGQFIGADLVGDVTVGGDAVCAEDDYVHFAGAHQVTGGIVGNQVHGDLGVHEFPGGEARPLQTRTGLIHPNVDRLPLFLTGEDDAQRRAKIDSGQRAGVAMMEQVRPIGDDGGTVKAHAPVDGHVFVGQGLGFGQEGAAQIVHIGGDSLFGHFEQAARGPTQVDGGRPRGVEHVLGGAQIGQQVIARGRCACLRGQCHAVGTRCADGRCATHVHLGDATGDAVHAIELGDHKFAGQQPLVDHFDAVVFPKDGSHNRSSTNKSPLGVSKRELSTMQARSSFRSRST